MKKMVTILSILCISSTVLAGSDSLKCSSADGTLINGSLWNGSAGIVKLGTEKLTKISVVTVEQVIDFAYLKIEDSKEDVAKEIQQAKEEVSKNNASRYIVSAAGAENVISNKEESRCRDTGDKEFTQKLTVTAVEAVWDYKDKKTKVQVSEKTKDYNCHYTYATTTGGSDCN